MYLEILRVDVFKKSFHAPLYLSKTDPKISTYELPYKSSVAKAVTIQLIKDPITPGIP